MERGGQHEAKASEQVIRKLAEGEKLLNQGDDVAEVCRQLEITQSTWHR